MPSPTLSQDLEARFSVFLNPIRDLTKNWEVDIAKYLEEYLEELAEVQITFDGGQTLMNFAEAAMLIQGSATVYSKKVEFLWQMVLQMLDLLSNRRGADHGGAAGGKEAGGGGGGKAMLDGTIDFQNVDNLGEGRNIDMREEDEDEEEEDNRNFPFLPATPLHLVEKEGEKSQHRVNLLMKNAEVFGAKDDFRINRSYLTPMGMLCLEVPAELLKEGVQGLFASTQDESEVDQGPIENPTGDDQAAIEPPGESQPQTEQVGEDGGGDHGGGAFEDDGAVDLDFDDIGPPAVEEQPMEVEKEEVADKSKEQKNNNNNNLTVVDIPNGRYGLRRRGHEKEVVATLKLTDPWKAQDPHAETPAKRPIRAGRLRKPLPCACHRPTTRTSRSRPRKKNKENKENNDDEKEIKKKLPPVENFVINRVVGIETTVMKGKVPSELIQEAESEATKRQELNKKKRVKELLKEGATDLEEAVQKLVEETQDKQIIEKNLDDDHFDDGAADLDLDDLPAAPMFLPEPHDGTREPEGGTAVSRRLNESQGYEPGSDYEALVQKWVSDYITTAQDQVNSSELAKRVNKWKDMITPVLNQEEERQAFDIHSYGSEILGHFPENGRKQTVPFNLIAKNHDPKEVSRLFLSCLMLANTYNIELNEEEPGDFSMDCLMLTLLSRVRHHEELEEYAAPSQDSPTKRKGRPKAKFQSTENSESTPICADITQITVGENIHLSSKDSKKGKVKKKR